MSIIFDEQRQIFNISTSNTSYIIRIFQNRLLLHLHYGKRIDNLEGIPDVPLNGSLSMSAHAAGFDGRVAIDVLPQEYGFYGTGDYRTPSFLAEYEDGSRISDFVYDGYQIVKGKQLLNGLPSTYVEEESEADTLEIYLADRLKGIRLILRYCAYNILDAITRNVIVENNGTECVKLKSVMSVCVDFADMYYDLTRLQGAWLREKHIEKNPLAHGRQVIDSKRGASGHDLSPFMALSRKNCDEVQGEVYGFSLVYSGNFEGSADVSYSGGTRVNFGINSFDFGWMLNGGECFTAPEVVMVYSDEGFGKMSRTYHKLYRTRLCRGKYRDKKRPLLINNWGATHYDFNEDKLILFARRANEVGVEMLVLDDGWFGKRNTDNCSLGDWYADVTKLPNGLNGLAKRLKEEGMSFGLWIEPEMVSPDSDLYRTHPEWCVHVLGRERTLSRRQLVLDLTRNDVREFIKDFMRRLLSKGNISYIKWDMNRNITEAGSQLLDKANQQEFWHRYILGLYELLEELTLEFPDVLFEGCSGGGGRFDAGMLYYCPQVWTSDMCDAAERMKIQYGTSMVMPASTMSSHIAESPDHHNMRSMPLETRADISLSAQFGFEVDIATLSENEIEIVREKVKLYDEIWQTIQQGDMYRLASPFEENCCSFLYVSEDKSEAVLMFYTLMAVPNSQGRRVMLKGLKPDGVYVEQQSGKKYSTQILEDYGISFPEDRDFKSSIMVFKEI